MSTLQKVIELAGDLHESKLDRVQWRNRSFVDNNAQQMPLVTIQFLDSFQTKCNDGAALFVCYLAPPTTTAKNCIPVYF